MLTSVFVWKHYEHVCSDVWHRYLVYKHVCSFQACMLAALIQNKLIAISGKWFKTMKQFYYNIQLKTILQISSNKFLTIKDTHKFSVNPAQVFVPRIPGFSKLNSSFQNSPLHKQSFQWKWSWQQLYGKTQMLFI